MDRGSQLDEEDDEEDDEEEERRRGEEEQATDIKSNNPHLAGGEKTCSMAFWSRAMGKYPPSSPSHLTVLYTGYGLTFPNQPVYAKVPEASEIPRATTPRKFRWRERPHFYLC